MRNRKENGITLIALTVTIVVMLIIAGVSLSSLDGQDSSIGQAKDVKTATEYKEAKDSVRMAIQEALLASDKGMLERDIFEKYLNKHTNGAYEITNFLAYDDSERGQYTVVVYRDQEKKKKIDLVLIHQETLQTNHFNTFVIFEKMLQKY